MAEVGVKANEQEASRLFERGVAAARGGQRRVAAVLLARVVQLDPRHEQGWLWLSGVLDEPNEIAFCLRSVLALNPQNERARRGILWLEQRKLLQADAAPAATISASSGGLPVAAQPIEADADAANASWRERIGSAVSRVAAQPREDAAAQHRGESWWVNWRHSRREMGRARVLLWSMPILLLLLTLTLNYALRAAIERNNALIAAELVERAVAAEAPEPLLALQTEAPVAAVLESELSIVRDARMLAYLSSIEEPRARLRGAVESYRNATSRPGGSSIVHATSARRLRDEVERSYDIIAALQPPAPLVEAHEAYLQGLELELAALDHMLAFYSSFRIEDANRAVLTMEEAGRRFEQARVTFDRQQAQLGAETAAAHTIR